MLRRVIEDVEDIGGFSECGVGLPEKTIISIDNCVGYKPLGGGCNSARILQSFSLTPQHDMFREEQQHTGK